jgi:AcrR family transcriptional regulator
MTPASQAAEEQRLIEEAAQRLLGRTPQRSDGKITIASLAIEAGVSRQRLYEHHADVIAGFRNQANGAPGSPESSALRSQLAEAHERIRELEAAGAAREERIRTLCAVIAELTHEASATNVVVLPAREQGAVHDCGESGQQLGQTIRRDVEQADVHVEAVLPWIGGLVCLGQLCDHGSSFKQDHCIVAGEVDERVDGATAQLRAYDL